MPITRFIFRNMTRGYIIIFYLLVLQIDSCKEVVYSFLHNELIAIRSKRMEPFCLHLQRHIELRRTLQ